ncbi:MAG: hypothetical protein R8J84_05110 [Mariprofundales bacterium]
MIQPITIEQYRTTDGQTFGDRNEALGHQAELDAAPHIERYRNECMSNFTERFRDSVCKHLVEFSKLRAVDKTEQHAEEHAAPPPPDIAIQRQQVVARISNAFSSDAKAIKQWLDENNLPAVRSANSEQLKRIDEVFNQTRSAA